MVRGLVGQVLADRYRIDAQIGRGGFGAVYAVTGVRIGQRFAMKLLSPEYAEDVSNFARFRREAEIVARLRHPNIVGVIDWEILEEGIPCIIMEYLEGENLEERLRRSGPLPWEDIATFGDQMLAALSCAHAAGVVHRDFKPSNVFLDHDSAGEERVKVLDFGVCKVGDPGVMNLTATNLVLGSPTFMAPEQASGQSERVGPPSDVWAAAGVLYYMATARLPFPAADAHAMMQRIVQGAPEPLRPYRADAPGGFVELVAKTLVPNPEDRPAIPELRRMLQAALRPGHPVTGAMWSSTPVAPADPPSSSVQPAMPPPARREPRRRIGRSVAPWGLAVAVGLATGALGFWFDMNQDGGEAAQARAGEPIRGQVGGVAPPVEPEAELEEEGAGSAGAAEADADAGAGAAEAEETESEAAGGDAEIPALDSVNIRIESAPAGAAVRDARSGEMLGETPLSLELPRAAEPDRFWVERRGYARREIEVAATRDHTLYLELRRERKRRPSRPARRGSSQVGDELYDPFGGRR